jgi:glycerol dehydrogenase-like iron-containing ADH family enzyme
MRRTGFALTLEALHLDETEFILAATTARVIRERITVLDMAAQAGIMDTAAEDALKLLR